MEFKQKSYTELLTQNNIHIDRYVKDCDDEINVTCYIKVGLIDNMKGAMTFKKEFLKKDLKRYGISFEENIQRRMDHFLWDQLSKRFDLMY